MAIAFSGYFSASLPLLNQLSFYIVYAVLIDTFIVRSVLVPAVTGLLGKWNWFPMGRRFDKRTGGAPAGDKEAEAGKAEQLVSMPGGSSIP